MSFHKMLQQLWLLVVMILAAEVTAAQAKPASCPERESCGNLSIPYPFSTRDGCYLDDSFLITCNDSKPFLGKSNVPIQNISLDGQMVIWSWVAYDCYNASGGLVDFFDSSLWLSKFFVSYTRNKFTVVGCDTYAFVNGDLGKKYETGCTALCDQVDDVLNGSCPGIGCCQAYIPRGVLDFNLTVKSYDNHTQVSDFNPCGFAFVVEEGKYNFSSVDLFNLSNVEELPVALDWAIGNKTCQEARKDLNTCACGKNSRCYDSDNSPGYLCNCFEGYQGNPYLPNGCQDINECQNATLNWCSHICNNIDGNYTCSCPKGYRGDGDGRKDGYGCVNQSLWIKVSLGISISLLALIMGSSSIYLIVKNRKLIKLREKFFQQNGGIMLQQQLLRHEVSIETARIFTTEDLKKATNNYDESRVIGQGGYGTVYKGVLADNRVVAIKKSKISDQSQIEQFINEVIILSQINHRNVVKLLGCCLETEVPLLVYEYITNGTLSDHIHDDGRAALLSWEMRLKIAAEAAGAIAYLHSATSMPIIHRDIKSTNILLDDNYTTKVSDFGASKLVPVDHTQLTTLVQGTWGYLDPEYFHSSQLTEKSDVYSFGVLLAELLTGEKALSFDRPEKDRNLAMYFVSSMKALRLSRILDDRLVNEGTFEQVKEVSKLARRCLRVKGEERPTMKEVAMELEGLRVMEKHPWVDVDLYPQETEHLLTETVTSDDYNNGVSINDGCSSTAGYYSIRNQVIVPLDDGR